MKTEVAQACVCASIQSPSLSGMRLSGIILRDSMLGASIPARGIQTSCKAHSALPRRTRARNAASALGADCSSMGSERAGISVAIADQFLIRRAAVVFLNPAPLLFLLARFQSFSKCYGPAFLIWRIWSRHSNPRVQKRLLEILLSGHFWLYLRLFKNSSKRSQSFLLSTDVYPAGRSITLSAFQYSILRAAISASSRL